MAKSIDNKRIAKNAGMLTLRTVLSAIIGLYTSRVILNALGAEDFGVYGVVGGVTALFSFLTGAMAGATSRFLTFELGRDNRERLRQTFSSAIFAHLLIAAVVVVLAEMVGVWLLNTKLNIPEGRMTAAHWVLQLSIISTAIGIVQVPYNAMVIAQERMTVYAYVDMMTAVLKLAIAVTLVHTVCMDRLILFVALLLGVSVISTLIYVGYCCTNFKESRTFCHYQPEVLKPMIKYSGLDLFGNMCVVASNQGRNILINIFFGVVYNAAASIALAVQGTLLGLTGAIPQAFRPQIIKQFASGNIAEMQTLMERASTFVVISLSMLTIPLMLQAHYVLELWLGQVPLSTEIFLQWLLLNGLFNGYNNICNAAIHATGNIKYLSYVSGSVILMNFPLSWIAFKLGLDVRATFQIQVFISVCVIGVAYILIHRLIPQFRTRQFVWNALRAYLCVAVSFVIVKCVTFSLPPSFLTLVLVSLLSCIVVSTLSWVAVFDSGMRHAILRLLGAKLPFIKVLQKN